MKITSVFAFLGFIFLMNSIAYGQHHKHRPARNHHHHPHVKHRSQFRPAVVVVYRPHWAPQREIHRRWVYFPKHRLYWDNWRNLYFYPNGAVWVSSPGLPAHLIHLKLEEEKYKELKESDDDNDEIYLDN
jgi:hypothetical protein